MDQTAATQGFSKPATLRHVPLSASVGYEIHEYLAQEALMLDHCRFEEWLTLLSRDILYRCPNNLFSDERPGAGAATGVALDFDYNALASHASDLCRRYPGSGRSMTRRLISNLIVVPGKSPKEFSVRSYVLVTGASADSQEQRLLTVERRDLLRRCSHSYHLIQREIEVLDSIGAAVLGCARIL